MLDGENKKTVESLIPVITDLIKTEAKGRVMAKNPQGEEVRGKPAPQEIKTLTESLAIVCSLVGVFLHE